MVIVSLKEAREQGLMYYYTGKPCKYGHVAIRLTSAQQCTECSRIYDKQYDLQNKDARRLTEYNRLCRIHGGGGTHTLAEEEILLAKQNYQCANPKCKVPLDNPYMDHILPIQRKGSNNIDNIQFLCIGCNFSKGNRTNDEWIIRDQYGSRPGADKHYNAKYADLKPAKPKKPSKIEIRLRKAGIVE